MVERYQRGSSMARIKVDNEKIAAFCREKHIRSFALFGSVLRPDFTPESDIDVLVCFEPERVPGFFGIARMERELSAILDGGAQSRYAYS